MGKKTILGIGVMLASLGAIGTFNAVRSFGKAPVEKRDARTKGRVTSLGSTEFKNRRGRTFDVSYRLNFSFEAEDGQTYTGQETIDEAESKSLSKGQVINVIYRSHNPKSNAAVGYGHYVSVDAMYDPSPKQRLWVCLGLLVFGAAVLSSVPFLVEDDKTTQKVAQLESTYEQGRQPSQHLNGGDEGQSMVELTTARYLDQPTPEPTTEDDPQFEAQPATEPLGDLENLHPTKYVHRACGTVTEMPSHIRTTYLADPCFHSSSTICASCGEVPDEQCTWVDTGESLAAYMKRLKKAKSAEYHMARFLLPLGCGMLLTMVLIITGMQNGKSVGLEQGLAGVVAGSLIAYYPSKFIRLAMCMRGWI